MENTLNGTYGRFLGYPDCCIKAFGDPVRVYFRSRPTVVQEQFRNGFLPCADCATKLADGSITHEELINPRRKCSVPFKSERMSMEDEAKVDEELMHLNKDAIALTP